MDTVQWKGMSQYWITWSGILTEKVKSEQRVGGGKGVDRADTCGESIPGRRNSQSKNPKPGMQG